MWLRDTGMLDKMKWKNRVEDGRMDPYIPDPKVRVGKPLDITELGAAIFIEIGGVAIALLAFFVEICSSMSCFGKDMSQVIIIKVWRIQCQIKFNKGPFQTEQKSRNGDSNARSTEDSNGGTRKLSKLRLGNQVVDLPTMA